MFSYAVSAAHRLKDGVQEAIEKQQDQLSEFVAWGTSVNGKAGKSYVAHPKDSCLSFAFFAAVSVG